jgi:hypothetical protein
MTSVLRSVDWGGPALALLRHCKTLDADRPAVMHIRHTERHLIGDIGDGHNILSTAAGKEAAQEFGSRLPLGRRYRFFHSYYERARETAEDVSEGVSAGGGKTKVVGAMDLASILDREGYERYVADYTDNEVSASSFFFRWVSGLIPSDVLVPSKEFAKRAAGILTGNLKGGGPDSFDVYVSHDTWVANFMFHWFGLQPPGDWYRFLDGFIVQLDDRGMDLYYREKRSRVRYPHWWKL